MDFRGSRELSTSDIEDTLKENGATIRLDTFYDPSKARKVEGIIKAMLMAKGRPFAEVTHEAKNVGGSSPTRSCAGR